MGWEREFVRTLSTFVLIASACGGSIRAAEFHYPLKLAAAEKGPVYVADRKLPGILVVKEGRIDVYFAAAKKIGTPLRAVRCLALDRDGKLLAGDSGTREIYRFDQPGKPTPLTKGVQAGIGIPMGIAVDSHGDIFVADLEVSWIWKLPAAGGTPQKFVAVAAPRGLAIDSKDRLWIVSGSRDQAEQLVRVSPDRKIEGVVADHPFQFANDVAISPEGMAYVSDGYAKTIWKVDAGGKAQPWISGHRLVNPVGLAWRGGKLLIADPNPASPKGQVYEADATGKLTPLAGK